MPVITISRQFGAGGHTLGRNLARRLGYNIIDRGIIAQIAETANVSVKWVEAVEKEAGGGLTMRLINRLVSPHFLERVTGDSGVHFDEDQYLRFIRRIITDVTAEGDVVVVGRGAQFILPDHEQIIKILLVGDLEDRTRFIMAHYHLNYMEAQQWIHREEKRRIGFLRLLRPGDPDDPRLYTLVVNTSRVSLDEAENLIVTLVGRIVDEYAQPIW